MGAGASSGLGRPAVVNDPGRGDVNHHHDRNNVQEGQAGGHRRRRPPRPAPPPKSREIPARRIHTGPSLVSPRRESALKTSVAQTPRGEDAQSFKYYCPLCMEYFRDILSSSCCRNYICLGCCVEYLNTKNLELMSINDVLRDMPAVQMQPCPHCSSLGFTPAMVSLAAEVRDYSSVAPRVALHLPAASPLRVGDGFEALKRKMIPYRLVASPIREDAPIMEQKEIALSGEEDDQLMTGRPLFSTPDASDKRSSRVGVWGMSPRGPSSRPNSRANSGSNTGSRRVDQMSTTSFHSVHLDGARRSMSADDPIKPSRAQDSSPSPSPRNRDILLYTIQPSVLHSVRPSVHHRMAEVFVNDLLQQWLPA